MANFQYAAKDKSGKTIQGTIQANDRNEAVNQLRGRELIILKVEEGGKPAKRAERSAGSGKGLFRARPRASKSELVIFTRQLSTMIGAGISLLESLEVLTEQAETPGMKATCAQLAS